MISSDQFRSFKGDLRNIMFSALLYCVQRIFRRH